VRKIGISVFAFLTGSAVGIWTRADLRKFIQALFRFLTENHIRFHGGKDFVFFGPAWYYLAFGVFGAMFYLSKNKLQMRGKIQRGFFEVLIFFISLIAICYYDGAMKIMVCTACNDGTRSIHYNEVHYDLIVVCSLMLSMIPAGIKLLKQVFRTENLALKKL
jgi:hypothetical protein